MTVYTTTRSGAPARWTTHPASDAQVNAIRSIAAKVALTDEHRTRLEGRLEAGITKGKASEIIDWLKTVPVQDAPARPALPEVPEGRYAVEVEGTLGFFQVDRPVGGRWDGYTFVKQQASDDFYPVKGERRTTVLAAIAADVKGAAARYGRELGSCGICGRTLTDKKNKGKDGLTSLERGIGPDCAEKHGWI